MSTTKNTQATRWPAIIAVTIVVACGTLVAQPACAEVTDIDKMTGRDIRYVPQQAMYLANEQWLL